MDGEPAAAGPTRCRGWGARLGGIRSGPGDAGHVGERGLVVNGELMGAFLHINTLLIVGGNVSVRSCTYRLSVTIEVHALPWDSERDGRYKQTKETFVVVIQ